MSLPPTDVVPPAAYQSRNITTSSATPPAAAIQLARAQAAQLHPRLHRLLGGGPRREQRVAQQHRDRHRADAAGDRRDQPGALGARRRSRRRPSLSVRLPTSITVAPGLIQSPWTRPGRPTAATRTSARRQTSPRSRVLRVADGHGGVGGQQQRGDRACRRGPSGRPRPPRRPGADVVAPQQLHDPRRRARPQPAPALGEQARPRSA